MDRRAALLAPLLLLAACGPDRAPAAALDAAREAGLCGRVEDAARLLEPLLAAYGDDPDVVLLGGDVLAWRHRPEEALGRYRRAAGLAPDDARPRLHAAYVLLVHLDAGPDEIAAARAEAEAAESADDGAPSADLLACRGEIAWVEGAVADAERWFRRALATDPACRWALRRLVQIAPPDTDEHADLRARLDAALAAEAGGEGMSRGRAPVTFCGR